MAFYFVS